MGEQPKPESEFDAKKVAEELIAKAIRRKVIPEDPFNARTQDGDTDTGRDCHLKPLGCTGTIIQEQRTRYLGDPRQREVGPGGARQLTTTVTLYCSKCQIVYHKLPEQ